MSADPWSHKDEWKRAGRDFLVVVSRHEGSATHGDGPHRWCVYAYIYPKHPHFQNFEGPYMWQEAASCMPLHGGPSLLNYPMSEGKIMSVKVGADYNHLHDCGYTHCADRDAAYQVFDDADELFDWLKNMEES